MQLFRSGRGDATARLTGVCVVFWLSLSAFAQQPSSVAPAPPPPPIPAGDAFLQSIKGDSKVAADCANCGTIQSIVTTQDTTQWTPLGSQPGLGTPGALVAYQIGTTGSTEGPIMLGAAGGGAYRRSTSERVLTRYQITIKMDNGTQRMVTQNYEPFVREGDRVRVFGTQVELIQAPQ